MSEEEKKTEEEIKEINEVSTLLISQHERSSISGPPPIPVYKQKSYVISCLTFLIVALLIAIWSTAAAKSNTLDDRNATLAKLTQENLDYPSRIDDAEA